MEVVVVACLQGTISAEELKKSKKTPSQVSVPAEIRTRLTLFIPDEYQVSALEKTATGFPILSFQLFITTVGFKSTPHIELAYRTKN
jgi:hypothetical protein